MRSQKEIKVLVHASGRHVHLSREDMTVLFGTETEIKPKKILGADGKGDYLTDLKVEIMGADGKSSVCSVLGPLREETQIEVSYTEGRAIGALPPLGDSGKLEGTMAVRLKGPAGSVSLARGMFVARRHVHLTPDDADAIGVKNGDMCDLRVGGDRPTTFHAVIAKVPPREIGMEISDVHLDYDEWNAAALFRFDCGWLSKGEEGEAEA
ncbi:MAG: propanediol utilization protein [Clostridiales Family XIII bacterium]|jgi:putative phosphotransacetylase|nr:propanediol utilization protein [Clostridiales Family XIII bacterium]